MYVCQGMFLAVLSAVGLLTYSIGPVNGEVCVGQLPAWAHQVTGELCIIDQSTMVIKDFGYDGQGPDAHLYWYPTGNDPPFTTSNVQFEFRRGGGETIPHPETNERFPRGGVTNGVLEFSLPEGVYACDMAVFTIWCRGASSHFTGINIPANLFTTDPSEAADGTKILCTRDAEPPTVVEPPEETNEVCVGTLPNLAHDVDGELCIIDQSTMVIRNFFYDTAGPDAFLYWYPTGDSPQYTAANVQDVYRTGGGSLIPHPQTGDAFPHNVPGGIMNETLQFSLPDGVLACDMAVFTIWCRGASAQFTALDIPPELFTTDPSEAADGSKILCPEPQPEPVCVGTLPTLAHDVEGELCIIDKSTMVIKNFYYDTEGPDALLYWYPTGDSPQYTAANVQTTYRTGGGSLIPHPETGDTFPRNVPGGIVNETLQFSLPDGVFACDMAVFTIWCRGARTQFTALDIPPELFTTDPSEAADGSKILCEPGDGPGDGGDRPTTADFENCKQLDTSLHLAWTVDRSSESVEFMLCGCTSSDIAQDNTWLGFGLSGSSSQTLMFGADATIVWVDEDEGPQARDYFLSAYTQCRNGEGACPDTVDSSGTCSDDVTLIDGFSEDGQQCVVFSRKFAAADNCDLVLDPDNEEQYIVWGVGGLGDTAFRHFIRAEASDPPIHLGRDGSSDCVALDCSACDPFQNDRMVARSSTTFVAHIGPSGDQRGYMAITGRAGWGIAWFIDGTLIPELVVQRGEKYTFIVFGGDDSRNPAQYHPLYITDSISGGRLLNTPQENQGETVYAGFENDQPLGVGPLCEYKSGVAAQMVLEDCTASLSEYEQLLTPPETNCGSGATTNSFTWTPDDDTPDLVYYQCASHLNLGWKIQVVGKPDTDASAATRASFLLLLLGLCIMFLLQ